MNAAEHIVTRGNANYYRCDSCGQAGTERWAIHHQYPSWKHRTTNAHELLRAMLHWPNPFLPPITMPYPRQQRLRTWSRKLRRAWHRALQRLGLWQPAAPHIRVWDKHMNYLTTLQHPQPAHYTWPCHRPSTPPLNLGAAHINVVIDFDGHDKLLAAREHITTIATPPATPHEQTDHYFNDLINRSHILRHYFGATLATPPTQPPDDVC